MSQVSSYGRRVSKAVEKNVFDFYLIDGNSTTIYLCDIPSFVHLFHSIDSDDIVGSRRYRPFPVMLNSSCGAHSSALFNFDDLNASGRTILLNLNASDDVE